jgi:hypothetical protein
MGVQCVWWRPHQRNLLYWVPVRFCTQRKLAESLGPTRDATFADDMFGAIRFSFGRAT